MLFNRIHSLELCQELLRKYKTLMDSEKVWLSQTKAKVETMLAKADLDFVTVNNH